MTTTMYELKLRFHNGRYSGTSHRTREAAEAVALRAGDDVDITIEPWEYDGDDDEDEG